MESASNVERWCKSNRIGSCFAAKQGSLSFSRSVVEHYVRNQRQVRVVLECSTHKGTRVLERKGKVGRVAFEMRMGGQN